MSDAPDVMFEASSCWRLTDAAWAWVQRQRWEYRDGSPFAPRRDDTYIEHRDAFSTADGWAYRVQPSDPPAETETRP